MDFDGIVGQKEIKEALMAAVQTGKVGHAYILSGPRGIGKKSVARIFAKQLLCQELKDGKCCNGCMPCRLLANGTNPDFSEINPEEGSIGVEEIRKIHSEINIRPLYSNKKVYLIADAERMTVQAQNSLLKTLEEPPSYGVILLTVSNYGALLETIRSRAVKYSFRKNSPEEVKTLLKAKFGHSPQNLEFIAAYADGIIGSALELAGSEEFIRLRQDVLDIVQKLESSKLSEILKLYGFFEDNKSDVDTVLDIMLLFYRDLLAFKNTGDEYVLINSDKKDIILNSVSAYTTARITRNIDLIEAARRNIKQNANYQLSIEVMLMKLQEEEV